MAAISRLITLGKATSATSRPSASDNGLKLADHGQDLSVALDVSLPLRSLNRPQPAPSQA